MKPWKIILAVLLIVVAALAAIIIMILIDAGEFQEIVAETPKDCRLIGGVHGSEDIVVDRRTGLAFISSCDFRALAQGGQPRRGAIHSYDLEAATPTPIELTADFKGDLNPHGLGLLTGLDGKISLFVVNHRADGHAVEIFDYREGRLIHRRSITSGLLVSPNDVVPVGPEQFYVTNDHGSGSSTQKSLEDYLRLARAHVLYFDGQQFRRVAEGLSYANGINVSPDGLTLYVAETIGRRVDVYRRDPATGTLFFREAVDLDTGVDNIDVDPEGNLWIGAHPRLLTFARYARDPARRSPSQVLKVTITPGKGFLAVDEYLSEGQPLSGSSVGVRYKDKLLIGSVFDDGFLVCRLPGKTAGQ